MRRRTRGSELADLREPGGYTAWPHVCAQHPHFYTLGLSAKALLFEFLGQYRPGRNNGDLMCAYSVLHAKGWKSKGTVQRARDELLRTGWIVVTRYGSLGITELYALTFLAIDECGGKIVEYQINGKILGYWKTGSNPDYKSKRTKAQTVTALAS